MTLQQYRAKRNFTKTPEPSGKVEKAPRNRFVIQKHAASHLHYDFRLQISGTLKSWAVPKGFPFAKGQRRLAIQVEDHPVSYIQFEGTIPKGQYGGGTVMVWDQGTFTPDTPDPATSLENGKLHFTLSGKKLKGEWHLVRMKDPKEWLLIKSTEDVPPISDALDDTSSLTGRSMAQITQGDLPPAKLKKRPEKKRPRDLSLPKSTRPPTTGKSLPILPFVEPMKALLVDTPPPGDWLYEIKFDGFRALAFKDQAGLQLLSRNNKDFSARFPQVHAALGALDSSNVVLDGEVVALDKKGVSSFQLLQAYQLGEVAPPIHYYVFDLLWHHGKDMRALPLQQRKETLKSLLQGAPDTIRFSDSLGEDAPALLKLARKLGLEGLIGKRAGSTYETGKRTGAWVKLKLHAEQEFVIAGFTPPSGSRTHFGALLLGVRQDKNWIFTGKVGTGFTHATLKALHAQMTPLAIDQCPFSNLPEKRHARYGQQLTPARMARCQWLKPHLVAQVKFSGWTRDGMLRQPVFMGLREDRNAIDVVREEAQSI